MSTSSEPSPYGRWRGCPCLWVFMVLRILLFARLLGFGHFDVVPTVLRDIVECFIVGVIIL